MKKNNKIFKYVDLGVIALAVIALIMIFLPAIGANGETVNGLKIVFGYKESVGSGSLSISTEFYKFSFLNLLTYILVLATAACAAIALVKKNKTFLLVAAATALVAGVFFLLTKNFVVLPIDNDVLYDVLYESFRKNTDLGVGPIIGAICMFLAAIASGAKWLLDK